MKLYCSGVTWGGQDDDWYWFFWWNLLPKKHRYFGITHDWYDGPIGSFGYWYGNMSWSTPWTKVRK